MNIECYLDQKRDVYTRIPVIFSLSKRKEAKRKKRGGKEISKTSIKLAHFKSTEGTKSGT